MTGIKNNRLNLAGVWNTMRPDQWFNRFGHVRARNQIFPSLFDYRKTEPTAGAVDHRLATAADKFQRILYRIRFYLLAGTSDARGQSVKLRDVLDAKLIATAYLDNLPSIRAGCRSCDGNGQERDCEPTFHWEDHACAIVSETCQFSRNDGFPSRHI
jgi:hypothetical protein